MGEPGGVGEQLLDLWTRAGADEGVAAARPAECLRVLEDGDGAAGGAVSAEAEASDRRAAIFQCVWAGRSAQGQVRQHDPPVGQADAGGQAAADFLERAAAAGFCLH